MNKAWKKRDLLWKLDTRNAKFMDHTDILQKTEDKKEINKDSVCVLESPYLGKR